MSDTEITIVTSCGKKFKVPVSELTDRQLEVLLKNNADRGCDPLKIAAMRDELSARSFG